MMNANAQIKTITWHDHEISLSLVPDYFENVAHLEIRSLDKQPLPITETGYRSHFFHSETPPTMTEVIDMVSAWINKEAKTKRWQNYETKSKQLDLFEL